MATFDGWEAQLYGPNTLAHFRTKGSKNGVRRFQNEDGTWTPLGLKERKAREGWGDGDRKARKAARAEKRAASANARKQRIAAYMEEKRKNNPKHMTDAELKKRIERAQLEKEYRELTKSPVRQLGEKLVASYFDFRNKREERRAEKENRAYEMMKLKEQTKQAELRKAETEARSKADTARAEADKAKAATDKLDIEKGTRMKQLKLDTKRANSTLTVHGGLMRAVNTLVTSGAERRARASEGRRAVNKLFRTRARVDRYNEKHPNSPMVQDPHEWDRWNSGGGKKNK